MLGANALLAGAFYLKLRFATGHCQCEFIGLDNAFDRTFYIGVRMVDKGIILMNDDRFIATMNTICRKNELTLPVLSGGSKPSSEFLTRWASFLELCDREGVALSDDRWDRLRLLSDRAYSRFVLEQSDDAPADPDFRVGLQLLMGVFRNDGDQP